MNDAEGDPIEANDGESCLFKDIARDANGNLSLTLGDGKVITLPIQQVLNLTLSTAINTTVVDPTVPRNIEYELHGEHARKHWSASPRPKGSKSSWTGNSSDPPSPSRPDSTMDI